MLQGALTKNWVFHSYKLTGSTPSDSRQEMTEPSIKEVRNAF